MQSKDIKVGVDYAVNFYGSTSGQYAPGLGSTTSTAIERVTVAITPTNGYVQVRGEGGVLRTLSVRRVLGTWEEHAALAESRRSITDGTIAKHRMIDEEVRALLGETYEDHKNYIGFRVENDGSFSRDVRLPRTVFKELIEAAYAAGHAAGKAEGQ